MNDGDHIEVIWREAEKKIEVSWWNKVAYVFTECHNTTSSAPLSSSNGYACPFPSILLFMVSYIYPITFGDVQLHEAILIGFLTRLVFTLVYIYLQEFFFSGGFRDVDFI